MNPETVDLQHPTPELLLWAYRNGIFPMAEPETGRIDWFSPDPRGILPLEDFHVPKSLARVVRQGRFEVRFDTAFEAVMQECARPREYEDETWISDELIHAYARLFELGHAHSVEAWREGELVGGLYGVHVGAAFFGESMFSRPERGGTDASKVCLVHLVEHLRGRGFTLLDTQFWTPHLDRFGCVEVRRTTYLALLSEAICRDAGW